MNNKFLYSLLFLFSIFFKTYSINIDSLIKITNTELDDTSKAFHLNLISSNYIDLSDYNNAIVYAKKALELSEILNYTAGKARAYFSFGFVNKSQARYEKALLYYTKSLGLKLKTNDYKMIANLYNNIGNIYFSQGDNANALVNFFSAVSVLEKNNNKVNLGNPYINIGNVYNRKGNNQMALAYYNKAKEIGEKHKNKFIMINALQNISNINGKLGKYEKAIKDIYSALKLSEELGIKIRVSEAYLNLGSIYFLQKKHAEVIKMSELSLNISRNIDYKLGIEFALQLIAKSYLQENNFNEAINYFHQTLELSKQINDIYITTETYKDLYLVYEKINDLKNAFLYSKLYAALNDSLLNEKNNAKVEELKIRFETEKKDKEIIILNNEKQKRLIETKMIVAEKEKNIVYRNFIILILFVFFFLLFIIYNYFNFRKQQKQQTQFTKQLIASQEDERKRISKELHDGIGQNLLVIKSSCNNNPELIQSTIDDLRNISRNMHPVQLEKLGFKKAVESIIKEIEKNTTIFFSHDINSIDELLDSDQQINLYRIIQEAISNILKHSNATDARVSVIKLKNKIITTIIDNGNGFKLTKNDVKSLGLHSIKERASIINGNLIISSDGKGTKIEIEIKHEKG